ncbi:hypothetical protein J5N97_005137 [Dioscorea zingiberensis]|uniref:Uncharacterized protein n=1 Tax=Dioscorea zingiberensis TaxID=325984 RepID=A0A9D5D7J6_9LILI|nr:hypothetical protein J5N97_005137 [Dioscorea zingiberensis]
MSNESKDEKINLTKSLLSSISEIMSAVLTVDIEKEKLLEFEATSTDISGHIRSCSGEIRTGRHERHYLEGLVGILLRFTTTLYDHEVLHMAKEQNLVTVFSELLTRKAMSDEVRRMSAIGLENLSSESVKLSKPAMEMKASPQGGQIPTQGLQHWVKKGKKSEAMSSAQREHAHHPPHSCLLESRALEKLIRCLEHENVKVVDAALSAICTLLDAKRWMWTRVWRNGERIGSEISGDGELSDVLVDAYHHGNSSIRQLAHNMLRHLKRKP